MTTEQDDFVYVGHWPEKAISVVKGRTKFAPLEATIARRVDGPGYVFEGDPTHSGRFSDSGEEYIGVIWWLAGEWNDTTKKRDKAIDPGFGVGDRVIVNLETYKLGDSVRYGCLAIRAGAGTVPRQAPAAPQSGETASGVPRHPRDATRLSIERQQAFIKQADVLCAKIAIGMPVEDYKADEDRFQNMRDVLWGDPSPLVTAALEMGATNPTEVEDTWELPADE